MRLSVMSDYSTQHALFSSSIGEDHSISFAFNTPQTARDIYSGVVMTFRRLLSLFTGKRVFIDEFDFINREPGKPTVLSFLASNHGVSEADRETLSLNMRVPYAEIKQHLPAIIQKWFAYHDRLKSVLNLYFAVVFNEHLFGNNQFLFLAQALEVYHSSNPHFTTYVQTKSAFRARVKQLLSSVSPGERSWLKEKLSHANQKTLAQRLDDILNAHSAEVAQIIPDRTQFANWVRHTRNYFTHFDEELRTKRKIAEGEDLLRLTCQMQALIEICVLKDLGIQGAPIKRIIHRTNSYQYSSL